MSPDSIAGFLITLIVIMVVMLQIPIFQVVEKGLRVMSDGAPKA